MKRSIKILLTVLLIMMCIVGTVNASSITMELNSNSKLVAGDTVVVTLRIKNIDAGDGVDAISGNLVYDANVFETITDDNYTTYFQGVNSWNSSGYNAQENRFTATRGNKVNMASDVLQIKLKAKTAVTVDSTTIQVKDIEFSGGMDTGDINPTDVSIKIDKASQITPDDPNKTNTQPTTNTQKPVNTQSPINSNNTPNTKLPQTGDEYGIVLAIAVVAIISIIAYIRYKNVNIK